MYPLLPKSKLLDSEANLYHNKSQELSNKPLNKPFREPPHEPPNTSPRGPGHELSRVHQIRGQIRDNSQTPAYESPRNSAAYMGFNSARSKASDPCSGRAHSYQESPYRHSSYRDNYYRDSPPRISSYQEDSYRERPPRSPIYATNPYYRSRSRSPPGIRDRPSTGYYIPRPTSRHAKR